MKMPEKHDLLAAILAAMRLGAILAFAMAYLRGRYNGSVYKNSTDATMCAIIA